MRFGGQMGGNLIEPLARAPLGAPISWGGVSEKPPAQRTGIRQFACSPSDSCPAHLRKRAKHREDFTFQEL